MPSRPSIAALARRAMAETLIAINSDPEAPIFAAAHLGIVGDLHAVLPALIARLERGEHVSGAAAALADRALVEPSAEPSAGPTGRPTGGPSDGPANGPTGGPIPARGANR